MGKRAKYLLGVNVILLGLVSLINDFSSEMISPVLPLLISSFGGTGLIIGLIGGMIDGLPNLLKVFSGYLSDMEHKRKKFVFAGYLTSEIFKFFLLFANSWGNILLFMGFNKLGKGVREAPRDALISDSMPLEKGKAFGIQRAFDVTGAVIGSLTVLLLVLFFNLQFKQIIFIAALIGFVSLIPLYFLKETKSRSSTKKIKKEGFFHLVFFHLSGKLKMFILAAGIFAFANFSYMFFILKSSNLLAGASAGTSIPTVPILLYVLFNIFYAVFAIPFGRLSDEIGRRKVILCGYFLMAVVCGGFIFANSIYSLMILFILYGIIYAMVVGNQRAMVSDLSSEELRATALGALQTTIGIAAIVTGILAGWLFDINPNYTFIYGAMLSLLACFILLISFRKYPSSK